MELISLVGPRSVGKSTIGRRLSKSLNYQYIDLDSKMNEELKAEGGIGGYTKKFGWRAYAQKQHNYLTELVNGLKQREGGAVLDCGGGLTASEFPESKKNAKLLKKHSKIVLILPHKDEEKGYEILTAREVSRDHFKEWDYNKVKEKTVQDYRERVPTMKKDAHYEIHIDYAKPSKIVKDIEDLIRDEL